MGAPKRQFSRPSINLGGPKKDWQEVEVYKLAHGDTVRGWGTVRRVEYNGKEVSIVWQNGTTSVLDPYDVVTAFTEV